MKVAKVFAYTLICCLCAGCNDDSLVISKTDKPTCQGKNCSDKQDPDKQDPDKQDPDKQDPDKQDPDKQDPDKQDPPDNLECNGVDLKTDPANCGKCGFSCEEGTCQEGLCVCNDNWLDCNGDGSCETEGQCECTAGETKPCYDGDDGTAGIGACKSGYYACKIDGSGAYWDYTDCIGQVLPAQDLGGYVCDLSDPNRDNDCNGIPDTNQDEDKDGYPICKDGKLNDCCDNVKMCNTSRPDLIHPDVKLDCKGNYIDDNCNGITDEDDLGCDQVVACEGKDCETQACSFDYGDCDINLNWNHSNNNESALLLARSMDLCMGFSSDPTKGSLLEYSVHRAGSNASVGAPQINILKGMRDNKGNMLIKPRIGQSFALLSSGRAIDALNGPPAGDEMFSNGGAVPSVYLQAHGYQLESHPKCQSGNEINDTVVLHFKIQAPQNAKGFSFDFRFFSFEYPSWICTNFNDFFLTVLTDQSGQPLVNADGNISFDEKGNAVSVNNAFFTTCAPRTCSGSGYGSCPASYEQGCQGGQCNKCDSYEELYAFTTSPYDGNTGRGGATAWLSTQAPIQGGQIFNLDFYIWDTGDQAYDSTVILDNFQWLCDATLNTGFAPPIDNPIN